jgi:hypothetical protein
MKIIIAIMAAVLLFAACEKEAIEPQPSERTGTAYTGTRDTRNPLPGIYEGTMYYSIPGHVDTNVVYTRRTIRYTDDTTEITIKWADIPDTIAFATPVAVISYTMTLIFESESCGLQKAIYDYYTTATVSYDSIFETGTIRYRWYYDNELRRDLTGRFTAKLKRTKKL